jgi:hypothetical protein
MNKDINLDNPFPEPFELEITDTLDLHAFAPRDVKSVTETYLTEAYRKGFQKLENRFGNNRHRSDRRKFGYTALCDGEAE